MDLSHLPILLDQHRLVAPCRLRSDHEPDGDYLYTSAELVLLDDPSLEEGWVDAQQLADAEVGRSEFNVYYVDSDIPASANGHFGIGPVDAGFHLLERQADREVSLGDGVSGAIAVWEEVPLDTEVVLEAGEHREIVEL